MSERKRAQGTRILDREGMPSLVLDRFVVEVIGGPDQGRSARTSLQPLSIGTGEDNALVLSDAAVSKRHCELRFDEHGVCLHDLRSTNGCFVGGQRARVVYLADPSEIRIGDSVLRLRSEGEELELPLSRRTNFGALIGHGAAMRAAFSVLERAAKTDVTVLVNGESGTGKELAARALHAESKRAREAYVVVDCGAIAASLVESQLFGHAKGAFTGAVDAREGAFEQANGGTLVLDEIGELPLELQPKLLRAIENRSVTRVGEHKARKVDLRIVASTHRDLEQLVADGRFRQDLYFRLAVLTVVLPPLRDRPEEVGRLLDHFLSTLAPGTDLPADARQMLLRYDWPGNVRELRNVVERFATLPDLDASHWMPNVASQATRDDGAPAVTIEQPFHEAKAFWVDRFERAYLAALLDQHGGNISEAARVAGLSRQSCYRLLRKHGLEGKD